MTQTIVRGVDAIRAVRHILTGSSLATSDVVKAYEIDLDPTRIEDITSLSVPRRRETEMVVNADRRPGDRLAVGVILDVIWSLSIAGHRLALNDLALLSEWDRHVVLDALAIRFGMTPTCQIPVVPASSEVADHSTGRNRI